MGFFDKWREAKAKDELDEQERLRQRIRKGLEEYEKKRKAMPSNTAPPPGPRPRPPAPMGPPRPAGSDTVTQSEMIETLMSMVKELTAICREQKERIERLEHIVYAEKREEMLANPEYGKF